jgi:transposase-like protein
MEKHQKGSNGRRLFSVEFKQESVRRVTSGEITAAELSRELGIQPSLLQHWKRCINGGARVAVTANEDVVPVSELKARDQRIRELERALGRKTMEVEILQAARDEIKKASLVRRCREMTNHPIAAICHTLGVGRATPYRATTGRPVQYAKADDPVVAAQIREVIRQRGSYG